MIITIVKAVGPPVVKARLVMAFVMWFVTTLGANMTEGIANTIKKHIALTGAQLIE